MSSGKKFFLSMSDMKILNSYKEKSISNFFLIFDMTSSGSSSILLSVSSSDYWCGDCCFDVKEKCTPITSLY